MIALDTNVLVRVLTRDDPSQARRAAALLNREDAVFVAKTVLLETEWVLRSAYRYEPAQVLDALHQVLAIGNGHFEDEEAVLKALEWYKAGMDFADALHVASSGPKPRFATFDRHLRRQLVKLEAAASVNF